MPKYVDGAGLSRFWDNIQGQIGSASQEQVNTWLNAHPEATTTVQDGSITDAKLVQTGGILETFQSYLGPTRNINTAGAGRYGINSSGAIGAANNNYVGMPDKVPCEPSTTYTATAYDTTSSSLALYYAFYTENGTFISRAYTNNASSGHASFITPDTAHYLAVHFYCNVGITVGDNLRIQVEQGSTSTEYVRPYTMVDLVARDGLENSVSVMDGMLDDLETIFTTREACYFEPEGITRLWCKLSTELYLRGKVQATVAWANVLPGTHEASPNGVADCIAIPHNSVLVYDTSTSTFAIVSYGVLDYEKHVPVLWVGSRDGQDAVLGGIGYHLYVAHYLMSTKSISAVSKVADYAALVNDSVETEQFIYFTDPHLMGVGNDTTGFLDTLDAYTDTIKLYSESTPTTFVLCGGDWLKTGDDADVAKWKLGMVYGKCKKFNRFYDTIGNHDSNYLGDVALVQQVINNLLFGGEHPGYYSFDGSNTRFYNFDSEHNDVTVMNAYRWEQIAWFANALIEDDKSHSAVSIHIWYTDYNDQTADTISALATNITSVISAYNGRTSVTLNGVTYSFANCTGHVEFVISGHCHFDKSGAAAGIPVINTTNLQNGNTPTFDLVYVDYDNRVLHTVRVGTGSDRTFSLASLS